MTDRSLSTHAARAGGRPLARAGLLALVLLPALFGLAARAQNVTWELLPFLPFRPGQRVTAVGFLRGEGTAAADPAADSLVIFHSNGVFLYNPAGAAGPAGANGEWGAWYPLCIDACDGPVDGLVTAAGTVLVTSPRIGRATQRGRRWTPRFDNFGQGPLFEATLPALAPLGRPPALFFGAMSLDGVTLLSTADGAPGTWARAGSPYGHVEAFGEVPPSPALPNGRLLAGVWNGALYSDDGGQSYTPSNAFGLAAYIVYSFAFVPQAGHPYGGVAYGGFENVSFYPDARAEVHRSDDGGVTWTLLHRFTVAETGQTAENGNEQSRTELLATPDGALWAGVSLTNGTAVPFRGGIMRSTDGGVTWQRADAGFGGTAGRGYQVHQLKLSRTGVLYASTDRGVWRTTGRVVSSEAGPAAVPEVGVSVRPNPAGGRVEVVLTLAEASPVRVVAVDALGREVAVVLDGPVAAGGRVVGVDTASWPAGVYVVRATARARTVTSRFTVVR